MPQFGVYEWCMTDSWDPSDPEHKALAHGIELGNGIPEMRPLSKAREAIKAVGFEIEHEEDLAERPDVVPWYYPLEGDIFKAQTAWDYFTVWRMSWSGKLVTHNALRVLEFFRIVPKGTWEVGETLRIAGDALVRGGQTKVRRPTHDQNINIFLPSASHSFLRQCTWLSRESLKAESVTRLHTCLYSCCRSPKHHLLYNTVPHRSPLFLLLDST
jgi:Sterol methyltransferase C-terminal